VTGSWVVYTAYRFLKNRRATRGLATALLSSGGIAAGVAALIIVISVMNGFQLGFIEDILEISSYHLRLETDLPLPDGMLASLRETTGVKSIVPMAETQTLIIGTRDGLGSCRVRGVPGDIVDMDPGFVRQLNIVEGSLDASSPRSVILGRELANSLAVGPGSEISLLTLSGGALGGLTPETIAFSVTGIFECGYYQYDRSLAVVSIPAVKDLTGAPIRSLYGIKLDRRNSMERPIGRLKAQLGELDHDLVSWRTFNSSFFGTLRTEKLVMMFLLGLIFLVTGFNTYHSLKRAIYEKREQIAVLRTLGARPSEVRWIFVFDGLLIGMAGGFAGVVIGLLLAGNINQVFSVIEAVVNTAIGWGARIAPSGAGTVRGVSFFSPVYFYLTEVPIRVLYTEVLGVFVLGVASSLLSSFLASKRITGITPAEVLRYE
jgi:lipoprotein-releasing system permease protein